MKTRNCTVQLFNPSSDSPSFVLKLSEVENQSKAGVPSDVKPVGKNSSVIQGGEGRGFSCLLRILVLFLMPLSEEHRFPDGSLSWVSANLRLLQAERARFLDSGYQLLVEHGEGRVGREVQTIKASVSPVETQRDLMKQMMR